MNPEQKSAIIDKLIGGDSLRKALRELGVTFHGFYSAKAQDPAFAEQYALARDARTEIMAEEILIIADEKVTDSHILMDGTPIGATLEQRKLQIDNRKWLLGKMNKRYSERLVHSNDPDDPMPAAQTTIINQTMTAKEAQESYAATLNDSEG